MSEVRIVRGDEGVNGLDCVFKVTGDDTDNRFDFMIAEVGYCSGPPLHTHKTQDDTFYVLDGVLTVQAGDELVELRPGDFVTVPPGVPHAFDNLKKDQPTVRAINLMTPGGFDHFMEDLLRVEDPAALDEQAQEKLFQDHGVRWVGPPLHESLGIS